ncbi:DUF1684 domain-containing protein [Emticicia sp. CRIBPO]|uniref:DUF1684 domain-containing protein n=1 Tax=Emticicia sp. CRIBPO TaxID=2683258 RepID=UPI001412A127|nr:DUF1684 domain-containing protein [Emticicia sp. CRIBPO]NBA87935.1 DUF1684 domain-containing protein [Emticicia sp. CRIBPO]
MFKNKFILAFIFIALAVSIFYSLNTKEDFNTATLKDRESYQSNLQTMEDSPLRNLKSDPDFSFFEPAEQWKIEADFKEVKDGKEFELMMTDSTTQKLKMAGEATFTKDGKEVKLLLFEEGETLLLPFRDQSNGTETYGGGRYININKKELLGGKVTIDFNKAHNFYCAYNEKYICPIPPRENLMPMAVNAGEKDFKH